MKPLRPMARFHLPFATLEETIIRSTSFYLLGQYFEHKRDNTADLDLSRLDEHYDRIRMVDEGILERITSLTEKDAGKSAFVTLNSLAQLISMEIDERLNTVEYLFAPGDESSLA